MFTNHLSFKYLVNKPVLWGENIFRWLLFLQKFYFEVIVKPDQLNLGLDHLSRLESGEEPVNLDDSIPNAKLFVVSMVDDYFKEIA